MKTILGLMARLLTKLLMHDSQYLRHKLLLAHVVHGPIDRLHLGYRAEPNDTIFNTLSGHVHVGDFTFFGHGCQVLTGTHDYARTDKARLDHPHSGRDIVIGKGVWIGSGAIILGKVSIVDYAVISAGAVVTTDCPEAAIYGGVPSKLLSQIDFVDPPVVKSLVEE